MDLSIGRLEGDLKKLRNEFEADISKARRLVGSTETDVAVIKESLKAGNRRFEQEEYRHSELELRVRKAEGDIILVRAGIDALRSKR